MSLTDSYPWKYLKELLIVVLVNVLLGYKEREVRDKESSSDTKVKSDKERSIMAVEKGIVDLVNGLRKFNDR